MMKIVAAVLVFIFILWLMPLGIFIKGKDQKIACNGQRAICMCTMAKKVLNPISVNGLSQWSVAKTHTEEKSPSPAPVWTLADSNQLSQKPSLRVSWDYSSLTSQLYIIQNDPVPKSA